MQAVWPQVAPYLDGRVSRAAEKVGLPSDVRKLAELVDSPGELARLSAALVRVFQRSRAADEIKRAATG